MLKYSNMINIEVFVHNMPPKRKLPMTDSIASNPKAHRAISALVATDTAKPEDKSLSEKGET